MFRRFALPVLLLLVALSTGCQLGLSPGGIGGSFMDGYADAPQYYAPEGASRQIKEAAAEEIQQSQQQRRSGPARNVLQAAPNTAMGY